MGLGLVYECVETMDLLSIMLERLDVARASLTFIRVPQVLSLTTASGVPPVHPEMATY